MSSNGMRISHTDKEGMQLIRVQCENTSLCKCVRLKTSNRRVAIFRDILFIPAINNNVLVDCLFSWTRARFDITYNNIRNQKAPNHNIRSREWIAIVCPTDLKVWRRDCQSVVWTWCKWIISLASLFYDSRLWGIFFDKKCFWLIYDDVTKDGCNQMCAAQHWCGNATAWL